MSNAVPPVCDDSPRYILLKCADAGRALAATISSKDHTKITALQGDFRKLKEDFDRAVDVAVLTLARQSGKCNLHSSMINITDIYD
jgi:major membrane immunogen (membrane-anchored lipoprotein)